MIHFHNHAVDEHCSLECAHSEQPVGVTPAAPWGIKFTLKDGQTEVDGMSTLLTAEYFLPDYERDYGMHGEVTIVHRVEGEPE